MWTNETLTTAETLCRRLHSRFVDSLDDETGKLLHTLELLLVSINMANGTLDWGPGATRENVERMLYGAIRKGAEALDLEDADLEIFKQKGETR